jgi:hypothetical protein
MTVVLRLKERFRERASEWFCAANLTQFGLSLLHPSETFNSPTFAAFHDIGENNMGLLMFVVGFAWFLGLIINGARQRATSTIRLICGVIGTITYGLLALGVLGGFVLTGIWSTGFGNYLLVSLLGLYSLYWIAVDKKVNG